MRRLMFRRSAESKQPAEPVHDEAQRIQAVASKLALRLDDPTFVCHRCQDTGYALRTDHLGQVWSRYCSCVKGQSLASPAKVEAVRAAARGRWDAGDPYQNHDDGPSSNYGPSGSPANDTDE